MDNKTYIWNNLLADIGNEYGVSALMGNLQAESGLIPYRLQGDFSTGYTTSIEYTAKVDSGEISEYDFVNNGPGGGGYGLAQWTFYTRKQELYNLKVSGGYSSIGSIELAVDFLLIELKRDYPSVYNTLKTTTSIRDASDKVLHEFERPADQSEAVEITRYNLSLNIYEEFTGTTPDEPDEPIIPIFKRKKKFNFILFGRNTRLRRQRIYGQR